MQTLIQSIKTQFQRKNKPIKTAWIKAKLKLKPCFTLFVGIKRENKTVL